MTTLNYRDLSGNDFEFEDLSEKTKKRMSTIGLFTPFKLKNELLYHLNLTKTYYYKRGIKDTTLSFAKGRRTYGGTEGYWEAAVIYRRKVKGVMGYLTEDDLLDFVEYIFKVSEIDNWFKEIPFKFYPAKNYEYCKAIRDKIFNFDYPLLGKVGGKLTPLENMVNK